METPICDFVRGYAESGTLRLHMPGHKGVGPLGVEALDITEISGADSLYEAGGIIRRSEENAARLFGCQTLYGVEGSSQCIRAMLYLTVLWARQQGKRPIIAAGRNAHKAFLSAAALLDLDVVWLTPKQPDSYLSCLIGAEDLSRALSDMEERPAAVYLTSPDYLGNILDLAAISQVCRRLGVLLLVDNAHGAYLKFLPNSLHPMDLGADACCASAHKTLPGLTGSAYLHLSGQAPDLFHQQARAAMALFGTTSPSYLILQSLDLVNRYLADGYARRLAAFLPLLQRCKDRLTAHGYALQGEEPLKITLRTRDYGYDGRVFARILRENGVECEFADPDFVVLMPSLETGEAGLERLAGALLSIPRREALAEQPPRFSLPRRVLSIREAAFSPCETVPAAQSLGRVLAAVTVGCPPAVPIVVCGERVDEAAIRCFLYYGVDSCCVVRDF